MTIARILYALVVAVAVAGCETDAGRMEMGDTVVASLLGSQIGGDKGQLAPTAAGTLLGAYLGSEVGKSLGRTDRLYAEDAVQKSLGTSPARQTSRWSNTDTGHTGTFTPVNTYRSADGLQCRDYDQSITIDGRTDDVYGTACLTDGGSWRIVETPVRRSLRRDRSGSLPAR